MSVAILRWKAYTKNVAHDSDPMKHKPNFVLDTNVITALQKMVDEAFAEGFNKGLLEARKGIDLLLDPQSPMPAQQTSKAIGSRLLSGSTMSAATRVRGIAATAIKRVFEGQQGLSTSAIHRRAIELGLELSLEAVGAELRRHEGQKYRRDEKRNWFSIDIHPTAKVDSQLTSNDLLPPHEKAEGVMNMPPASSDRLV